MADKLLKSIKFPTLPDRYVIGDSTLTEEGAAADAKAVGDALATKADTRGRYEDLIVGGAEQLISTQFVEDSEPYLFRPTGGSADVGNREYLDKIVGGTVAWNQLVNHESKTNRGITATYDSETHIYTLSGTSTGTYAELFGEVNVLAGHKYLCGGRIVSNPNSINIKVRILARMTKYVGNPPMTIGNGLTNGTSNQGIDGFTVDTDFTGVKLQYCCFDLTAMFGSTIADYIYSLEQATAGAGVAWFRNYFPKSYYPYDPGTLRSVEGVSAHETVGKNLLDAKPYSGFGYNQASGTAVNLAESSIAITQNDNGFSYEIASGWQMVNFKTAPLKAGTYHVQIGGTVSESRVSVYVVGTDGKTKGSAYNATGATAVSTNKTLLDGEYILVASGRATVGTQALITPQIELGSTATAYEPYTKHTYPLDSSLTLRGVPKLVDGKLAFDGDAYPPSGEVQRRYGLRAYQSGDESLADTITDGTNTVYKLATTTTETADGYEHCQICDPSGTEEFVTTGIVPVGHETRYPHDLKKKIETAPDSPSTDGTYLMKRSGGKNAYMALPSTPSANGAYVLTLTVSGGTASYSWTSKE